MARDIWGNWDIDNPDDDLVGMTERKDDGSYRQYIYTVPGDPHQGHGDRAYSSYDDYRDDNPSFVRDPNTSRSKSSKWHGNGFDFGIDTFEKLSESQFELIHKNYLNTQIHDTNDILIESEIAKIKILNKNIVKES